MNRIEELRFALQDIQDMLKGHESNGLDGATIAFLNRKINRVLSLDSMHADAKTWTVEQIFEREG